MSSFVKRVADLEKRFEQRAALHEETYIPNFFPCKPVDYILVGSEPSLRWGNTDEKKQRFLKGGMKGFCFSYEDFLVHYAIRNFLTRNYYLTDFAKGAKTVADAVKGREKSFNAWLDLLKEEIALVGPSARIISIGNAVRAYFERHGSLLRSIPAVIHYSPQARGKRSVFPKKYPEEYAIFSKNINHDMIVDTARTVLQEYGVNNSIASNIIEKIERGALTDTKKKLLFTYKCQFSAIKAGKPDWNIFKE